MRITCPNCNAQYEIGEGTIPVDGRDVQCSNCGTTWFQEGRAAPVTAVEERAARQSAARPPAQPDLIGDEADQDDDGDTDAAEPAKPPAAQRPGRVASADQSTLDILREERAREDRLRAQATAGRADEAETPRETAAVERARMAAAATVARARDSDSRLDPTEPDDLPPRLTPEDDVTEAIAQTLRAAIPEGLSPASPKAASGKAADGDASGDKASDQEDTSPEAAAAAAMAAAAADDDGVGISPRAARRELLPDIEEINSSLRPDERALEAAGEVETPAAEPVHRGSGFRIGFAAMCLAILALVLVYVFAGTIGQAVPTLDAPLQAYVSWVDIQRVALQTSVETLTERISPEDG